MEGCPRAPRLREVRPGVKVLLLHGWPGVTAEALPQLIASLREAGAEFVDVPSLGQRTVPR